MVHEIVAAMCAARNAAIATQLAVRDKHSGCGTVASISYSAPLPPMPEGSFWTADNIMERLLVLSGTRDPSASLSESAIQVVADSRPSKASTAPDNRPMVNDELRSVMTSPASVVSDLEAQADLVRYIETL